jgi:hypothetical protein
VTGFSREVRELVKQRASIDLDERYVVCEVQCRCPGRAVALYDLHHRRNRGAGGSKRPETNLAANSLAACRDCHSFITVHPEMSYRMGWLVKQNQMPAEVPVYYRHRWCLLDNEGNVTPADCVCGETGPSGWVPQPCRCTEDAQ